MVGYFTSRRKKYIKKAIVFAYCILIILVPILTNSTPTAFATYSAEIVMEAESLRVLSGSNVHARLPMASTTKAMTLLVAIERGSLDKVVTIPKEAVGIEGSSIYLRAGEKLTLRELCYGLMLSSGNDAAVAVAYAVAGSLDNFVKLMNEKAQQLHLSNTHFTNPHGLHNDNHYTSAYDLAVISCHGMRNADFRAIVGTQNVKISGIDGGVRYLTNKNKILKVYKDGNGIKTGFTKKAGRCLIASSKREEMQLVCVLLNCPSMFERSMQLMDKVHADYQLKKIVLPNQSVCGIDVKDGTCSRIGLCLHDELSIPLKKDDSEKITAKLKVPNFLSAPHKKEHSVGDMEIYIDNNLILTKKLYTMEDIKQKGVLDHFNDIIKKWQFSNKNK